MRKPHLAFIHWLVRRYPKVGKPYVMGYWKAKCWAAEHVPIYAGYKRRQAEKKPIKVTSFDA